MKKINYFPGRIFGFISSLCQRIFTTIGHFFKKLKEKYIPKILSSVKSLYVSAPKRILLFIKSFPSNVKKACSFLAGLIKKIPLLLKKIFSKDGISKCYHKINEILKKKKVRIAIVSVAGVILIICASAYIYLSNRLLIDVEPTVISEDVVSPLSQFRITLSKAVERQELENNLFLSQDIEFQIDTDNGYIYVITPKSYFAPGEPLSIKVYKEEFSFDIARALKVQTNPINKAVNYNVKSEISLIFDIGFYENFDPGELSEHFTIHPNTTGTFLWKNNGKIDFVPDKPLKNETPYQVTLKKGLTTNKGSVLCEDYVLNFTTEKEYKPQEPSNPIYILEQKPADISFLGNGISTNCISSDIPMLVVGHSGWLGTVNVKVFAFEDYKQYTEVLEKELKKRVEARYGENYKVDEPESTELITEFEASTINFGTGSSIIQFEETLNEGWYAVELNIYNLLCNS